MVAEIISEQQTNCFTWTGGDDIAKMTYPRSHLKLYNCAVSKHHMQQDCLRLHGTARHPEAKTACCASSRVSNPAPPAQVEFPYRMFATLVPHKSTGSEPCLRNGVYGRKLYSCIWLHHQRLCKLQLSDLWVQSSAWSASYSRTFRERVLCLDKLSFAHRAVWCTYVWTVACCFFAETALQRQASPRAI